jgi:hypothetical protein
MRKMTKIFALTVALFCLSLWIRINVYAEDTRPCADDISKFCKDVKPGGGRIANCLKEHENDLSPACKKRTEEMMMRAKEVHKACADDIDKFCKDVQPGKGNIARCLREHKGELSPECREEFRKARHRRY